MSTATDEKDTGQKKSGLTGWIVAAVLTLVSLVVVIIMVVVMALASLMSAYDEDQRQQNAATGCNPAGTTSDGVTTANLTAPQDVKKEQIKFAKEIDKTAQELGLPGKASEIAIITAYGESTLQNLDYGDQVHGVTNPDGSLATSYGLFQQQTSQGWGTKEEVTNPAHATKSFLLGPEHDGSRGLLTVPGWQTREITQVIHEVQGNADAGHYASSYAPARAIMKEAGIDTSRSEDTEKMQKAGVTSKGGKDKSKGGDEVKAGTVNDDCTTTATSWDGDLGDGEWTNPCPGCVKASPYGKRSINGVDASNGGLHYGVDLATPGAGTGNGTKIITPVDMKVSEIYDTDGCVFAVATSGPKFGFGFCHMNQIDVKPGQDLKRGDVIGVEGNKAGSVGGQVITHLHLELYEPGANMSKWYEHHDNLDPEPVLKKKGAWNADNKN